MGEAMAIFSGADKEAGDAHRRERLRQDTLIALGRATRTIYLNGGSDTRRDLREHYAEVAERMGVGFTRLGGWGVRIGGPRVPAPERLFSDTATERALEEL